MRTITLLLSGWFLFAGTTARLCAQGTVEAAAGAAASATGSAASRSVGKRVSGLVDTLQRVMNGAQTQGTGSANTTEHQTVRATTAKSAGLPAPSTSNVEDPWAVQTGMTYGDVIRRFGTPNLQVTDGPNSSALTYSSKKGRVIVEIEDGKVVSAKKSPIDDRP